MGDFAQTLGFLGLSSPIENQLDTCSFWQGREDTAFDDRVVNILQVRSFSSKAQLERELDTVKIMPSAAILTTIQERDRIKEILLERNIKRVDTEDEILFRNAERKFGSRSAWPTEEIYIQPTIKDMKTRENHDATNAVVGWIRAETSSDRVAIITGSAGFGKTTFCKEIVNTVQSRKNITRLPIYIDSSHWRKLVNERRFSVRSACSEAVANAYPNSAIGDDAIEHLISRGAILPIFDGLDELCTDAYTEASVADIIDQIESLFEEDSAGKAIFTSRSTFWADVRMSERMKLHEFEVLPFDAGQREAFLERWFKLHSGDRKFVDQTLSIVDSSKATSSSKNYVSAVRFSQSPYILRLVCLSATHRKGGDYDKEEFLNRLDPLDGIIIAAGNREVRKSGISFPTQCGVLFSLSLLHGDVFSVEEFTSIMQLYDLDEDALEGMLSHHFISNYGNRKSFLFHGMSDYLRAKALAEYIFKDNDNFIGIDEYFSQINNLKDTSAELFSDIASFYATISTFKEYFLAVRVQQHYRGRSAQGLLLLLACCGKKTFHLNRSEVGTLISEIFMSGKKRFQNLEFACHFEGFEFSGFEFSHCIFENVVFRDCNFDTDTKFVGCSFGGDFEVLNCENFDEVRDEGCIFKTMQARSTFDNRSSRASTRKVTINDIKVLVREALRLLNSRDNTFLDVRREGVLSRLQKKNSYLAAELLETMEKCGVLRVRNGMKGHRARVEVCSISDVLAFWDDGAEIGSVRAAISLMAKKHCQ
ncbi:NACHT domain-containing protein [Hoeflea marina]|uniref:NACHT domain-containing protein n=1 Tax=Hoeflea marina TaxID=274592 RepID=A0A317PLZ0_9HYPH|nr:NACHT domain-containing protein [Hoeflea marina]PWW01975.1 NACHT domain-containing protein [Hoeflea marina]